jgi:hypothetical protein
MKLTDRLSIYNFSIYWTIVLLGLVCVGCSSKKDEKKQDETASQSATSEEQGQIPSQKETKQPEQKSNKPKKILTKPINPDKKRQSVIYTDSNNVNTIIAQLDSAVGPERKIELIESLTELSLEQDPSVINVVQKALDDPNPEVQRAAIELLEEYKTPEILPVITRALKSPDEQTRQCALRPLSNINDPQVGKLLVQALDDKSEDVRSAAIEIAEDHQEQIKLSVMEKGITSPYNDVKESVISMLEEKADHKAVEILIMGLKNSDSYSHKLINEALDFLIDETFKTYEEARTWWLANKSKYDNELFKIEDQ